jgi:hypothetical protein
MSVEPLFFGETMKKSAIDKIVNENAELRKHVDEMQRELESEKKKRHEKEVAFEDLMLKIPNALNKVEILYRRCLILVTDVEAAKEVAANWRKKYIRALTMIHDRGVQRAKVDTAYAVWRDAMEELLATGHGDDAPINLEELMKRLDEYDPNHHTEARISICQLATEFGYEWDKDYVARPKKA